MYLVSICYSAPSFAFLRSWWCQSQYGRSVSALPAKSLEPPSMSVISFYDRPSPSLSCSTKPFSVLPICFSNFAKGSVVFVTIIFNLYLIVRDVKFRIKSFFEWLLFAFLYAWFPCVDLDEIYFCTRPISYYFCGTELYAWFILKHCHDVLWLF